MRLWIKSSRYLLLLTHLVRWWCFPRHLQKQKHMAAKVRCNLEVWAVIICVQNLPSSVGTQTHTHFHSKYVALTCLPLLSFLKQNKIFHTLPPSHACDSHGSKNKRISKIRANWGLLDGNSSPISFPLLERFQRVGLNSGCYIFICKMDQISMGKWWDEEGR